MRVADREWQLKMPVVSEDSRGELRIAIESCEFFFYIVLEIINLVGNCF